jgi:hypothetical protein
LDFGGLPINAATANEKEGRRKRELIRIITDA